MSSIWRRVKRDSDPIYGSIGKTIRMVLLIRGDIPVDVGIIIRI